MRRGGKRQRPEKVEFQTKSEIAIHQIRAAVAAYMDRGGVRADAAYGINTEFRDKLSKLERDYVVGCKAR